MPVNRSLHLVNFTEAQVTELRVSYPQLSAVDTSMSDPDYRNVADVTVIIAKTDEDAELALPTLHAAVEDITELDTLDDYTRTDPCVLVYITGYLQNLLDTPHYAGQITNLPELMKWVSYYQEALATTDGTDLAKTIGKLMEDGRDYLRSLQIEQLESANG